MRADCHSSVMHFPCRLAAIGSVVSDGDAWGAAGWLGRTHHECAMASLADGVCTARFVPTHGSISIASKPFFNFAAIVSRSVWASGGSCASFDAPFFPQVLLFGPSWPLSNT